MPFTVLKISRDGEKKKTEVMGEFESEKEARLFAQDAQQCDPDNEYLVESPPVPHKDPTNLS